MTSRDFCVWLQGFYEITQTGSSVQIALTAPQAELIKRHLSLVFIHEIDPSAGDAAAQAKLNEVHAPPPKPSPVPFSMHDTLIRC